MPVRTRKRAGAVSQAIAMISPPEKSLQNPEIPTRNLRQRATTAASASSNVRLRSQTALPDLLKAAIMMKRREWLEANRLGLAHVSDPIEEELQLLERQALRMNANAFRSWRRRIYV